LDGFVTAAFRMDGTVLRMAGADDPRFEQTRRSMIRMAVGALGLGAAGAASGHPGSYDKGGSGDDDLTGEPFGLDDGDQFRNASEVGYHSVDDVDPKGTGRASERHAGDRNSEVRTHGDIAVTSFRASGDEDAGRRMAVLDISEFNEAGTQQELENAELRVLSILRNFSAEANLATDLKLSNDGDYAFLGTQALVAYDGGSNGQVNESDPRGNAETSGGVVAVDISDPTRPRTVDRIDEAFSTGIHNLFHHRIDGVDYVFACKDVGLLSPDSGLYVLRFDRDPGKLTVVNRWTADGNTVRGEVGTQHGLSYVHDVEVHDDPRTGRPTAYVADWDRGMRVLDVSDPTDIDHVGQFDMYQSHFAAPFPDLVDGKRVAVASHEEPDERFDQREDLNSHIYNTPHEDKTNPNSTGTVFLVDCDGIYPEDPDYEGGGGTKQLGELDNWTWKNVDTGQGFDGTEPEDEEERQERFGQIHQPTFSFQLSPHNSQPAIHEIDGEERYIIHQGHYHGGVRYLEVEPGTEDGLTEIDGGTEGEDGRRNRRPEVNPNAEGREAGNTIGWINNTTDWNVVDIGHARPAREEAAGRTPDFWSSVVHNGVSYHGDRGAGVFATKHDEIPLEKPRPPLEAERADDGFVFTAGQTNRITITVETYERGNGEAADVLVRDRMPDGYEVRGGDETDSYPQGVRTAVEFQQPVEPGESRTLVYYVKVPEDPGPGTFGPVEVSGDGGDTWVTVGGTTDSATSTGAGQP
jgi:hypothetical protein